MDKNEEIEILIKKMEPVGFEYRSLKSLIWNKKKLHRAHNSALQSEAFLQELSVLENELARKTQLLDELYAETKFLIEQRINEINKRFE